LAWLDRGVNALILELRLPAAVVVVEIEGA
jgi:hypothetical protein